MAETIYATKDINKAIRAQIKKGAATRIEGLSGQDSIAVGLGMDVKVTIVGDAGDFFGALNEGTTLSIEGNSGRFLGDSMISGNIMVSGDAKEGLGANMYGGSIIVRGSAGSNVGAGMKGGVVIIDGDVGDYTGIHMFDGDIVIIGDAKKKVGMMMLGGSIYINGKIGSLGKNAMTQKLDNNDRLKLTAYLTKEKILGEFKFKKVTCQKEIPFSVIKGAFGFTSKKSEKEREDTENEA